MNKPAVNNDGSTRFLPLAANYFTELDQARGVGRNVVVSPQSKIIMLH